MLSSAIDNVIGVFSPRWAAQRMHSRATMQQMQSLLGGQAGYAAAKKNRFTQHKATQNLTENSIPLAQIDALRGASWDLYRNNPHARKIVRSIESKAIGKGMRPQSLAMSADGKPHLEFRRMARQVWNDAVCELDYRGLPGRGGQHLNALAKLALRVTILSGEVLFRGRPLTDAKRIKQGRQLPLAVQLIDALRLDEMVSEYEGRDVIKGIEIEEDMTRVAYHLNRRHPADPRGASREDTQRIDERFLNHLYVSDDVDQLRGVPWFAPALDNVRDTGDYQYAELKAALVGACVVFGYKRPTGGSAMGLSQPSGDALVDADGNAITAVQPGMLLDLGRDGEIDGFNPQRPNVNSEGFIQHMLRGTAGALPGVKSSTVTGDFRKSSFSSERAADNDTWPELEGIQQWFGGGFYQPIYEMVLAAAVAAGRFEGIITAAEFNARRRSFTSAEWQGPVARSINPKDDAEASQLEISAGTSSPQIEAAKRGRNWADILEDVKEFLDHGKSLGIPEAIILQMLAVPSAVGNADQVIADDGTDGGGEDDDEDETDAERGFFPTRFALNHT